MGEVKYASSELPEVHLFNVLGAVLLAGSNKKNSASLYFLSYVKQKQFIKIPSL